jgi:altronate dehydratase
MVYLKELPKIDCLVLSPKDNIGILVASGGIRGQDAKCLGRSDMVRLKSQIPKGHKIALRKIKSKEPIIKSGQIIGIAIRNIDSGEHVHIHNIKFSDKINFSVRYSNSTPILFDNRKKALPNNFKGFLRKDGRAGVRNYILVVSTVNCSAAVTREVAAYFKDIDLSKRGIDGVIPIIHQSGCAQSANGYTYKLLNRVLAGYLNHSNVVGGVIIGLGCEMITKESLFSALGSKYVQIKDCWECMNIQDTGGTKKSIRLGIEKVEKLLSKLPVFKRRELPVSLLSLALKCGGSDAFSAITANPALGKASDILVSFGGTAIIGELPECFGGENILLKRCLRKADKEKLRQFFSWWRDYTKKNSVIMNDNISLGNIRGGISTILEKSLGAIAKCGSSSINEVVDYAQRNIRKGLVFMNTPGFDPVAVTGLVAGGCNLVAFTTGRGSVYGCSISPTIKIATNSELYKTMKDDMDINSGVVLSDGDLDKTGEDIYRFLLEVASGTRTASEKNKLGWEEFVVWQAGEVL